MGLNAEVGVAVRVGAGAAAGVGLGTISGCPQATSTKKPNVTSMEADRGSARMIHIVVFTLPLSGLERVNVCAGGQKAGEDTQPSPPC